MKGRIQIALVMAGLLLGGASAPRVLESVGSNSQVLYLMAQYKVFTGDTDAANQLLRRAAASSINAKEQGTATSVWSKCTRARTLHKG